MAHCKGTITKREIDKALKKNDYTYVRFNGHWIWKNDNGNTIAIPRSLCEPLVRRVFKENGIKL